MLITILTFIGILFIFLIGTIVGKASEIENACPHIPTCFFPAGYWHEIDRNNSYAIELQKRINESNAYDKGFYEGSRRGECENRYRARDFSEQEIFDKLKGALKPLDSFRKDFGIK